MEGCFKPQLQHHSLLVDQLSSLSMITTLHCVSMFCIPHSVICLLVYLFFVCLFVFTLLKVFLSVLQVCTLHGVFTSLCVGPPINPWCSPGWFRCESGWHGTEYMNAGILQTLELNAEVETGIECWNVESNSTGLLDSCAIYWIHNYITVCSKAPFRAVQQMPNVPVHL